MLLIGQVKFSGASLAALCLPAHSVRWGDFGPLRWVYEARRCPLKRGCHYTFFLLYCIRRMETTVQERIWNTDIFGFYSKNAWICKNIFLVGSERVKTCLNSNL